MQGSIAFPDTASSGSAEGNDLFAAEIIAFQEGFDDPGSHPPPDRETNDHGVVGTHIRNTVRDLRSRGRIIHFHAAAAFLVRPVQVS